MFKKTFLNRNNAGFTLIELMVAISIISLLSSITFASVSEIRKKGYVAAGQKFESSVNAKIAADGLIAEYNFDEPGGNVIYDSSGNGQNLTLRGATQRVRGVMGNAIEINAITEGAVGLFSNFGYKEGSMSFWIKPTSFDPNNNGPQQTPILGLGGYNNTDAYQAYLSFAMEGGLGGGKFPGMWNCGNPADQWNDFNDLNTNVNPNSLLNRWNHFLITWNEDKVDPKIHSVSVYLNGKFTGQHTFSRNGPHSDFFWEGCATPGENIYLQLGAGNQQHRYGIYDMDRVRIYNKHFDLTD